MMQNIQILKAGSILFISYYDFFQALSSQDLSCLLVWQSSYTIINLKIKFNFQRNRFTVTQ